MRNVLRLAKHVLYRCPGDEDACIEGRCMFCDGGLSMCVICGGAEGSLPTDCPGARMSDAQETAIMAGQLDYRRDGGWRHLLRSANR